MSIEIKIGEQIEGNHYLEKTIYTPIILQKDIGNISGNSRVKTNQIRTVDKKRLKERIGKLPDAILNDIEKALKIHLEL